MRECERIRIEIENLTKKYLSGGGCIDQVDHTANHSFKQPVKRTRKQQVDYERKRTMKG